MNYCSCGRHCWGLTYICQSPAKGLHIMIIRVDICYNRRQKIASSSCCYFKADHKVVSLAHKFIQELMQLSRNQYYQTSTQSTPDCCCQCLSSAEYLQSGFGRLSSGNIDFQHTRYFFVIKIMRIMHWQIKADINLII